MHPRELRIQDFTYDLPVERIAQHPLAERDASKLLVYKEGGITDDRFGSLAKHLPEGALLVLNDTRVVKARIVSHRATGARIECMVLEPENGRPMELALQDRRMTRWWCMVGNAKRWTGEALTVGQGNKVLRAERKEHRDGEHLIEFSWDNEETFAAMLSAHGHVPLPPYMKRKEDAEDPSRYNTVFAERDGSVAAPTASLHFTPDVLRSLRERRVEMAKVTLHVGAGTFLPVKSERMEGHAMHTEQVRIPRTTVELLRDTIGHSPIVPVGTTALRTIESLCWFGDDLLDGLANEEMNVPQWRPYDPAPKDTRDSLDAVLRWMDDRAVDEVTGRTGVMIAPGYRFRLAEGLVTNFHQPGSTLLLLVAALIGPEWRKVYAHALASDYRLLSYGDGSLLWCSAPGHHGY
jgi:S-adenosylmethionine:tRNA ribosyltransferase-isomerase